MIASRLVTFAFVVGLSTTAVWAGRKTWWPVTVDLVAHKAWGSLGSTRNSPDPDSMLGCSVHYDYVNKKNNVNCAAMDANRHSAQCASQKPELVQIALGLNGDSYLEFSWDDFGECTNIHVGNSSDNEPKQP